MTATAMPTVKDQELVSFGLIESASVNSITDFTDSKSKVSTLSIEKDNEDFVNSFICHLIFYAFFFVSIVLHILIDLGLGDFIKNRFFRLIRQGKDVFINKSPAFA